MLLPAMLRNIWTAKLMVKVCRNLVIDKPKGNRQNHMVGILVRMTWEIFRAVVVAQLVERSLPISEVRGSNPVIGKNEYIELLVIYCQLY